jgi:hypothetical protein
MCVCVCMHTHTHTNKEVIGRTKLPTFLTLFYSTVSEALFNSCKLRSLFSMVMSPTAVTVVKQWTQLWDLFCTSMDGFNCHTTAAWLPWLQT